MRWRRISLRWTEPFLVCSRASKTTVLKISSKAQKSEILCKPAEEQNPRLTCSPSVVYQRNEKRALFLAAAQWTYFFCFCKLCYARHVRDYFRPEEWTKNSPLALLLPTPFIQRPRAPLTYSEVWIFRPAFHFEEGSENRNRLSSRSIRITFRLEDRFRNRVRLLHPRDE